MGIRLPSLSGRLHVFKYGDGDESASLAITKPWVHGFMFLYLLQVCFKILDSSVMIQKE